MAGPLDGIKVVELTQWQQGPVAGMRLGDLGAEVIKIEPPTGDPARGIMRISGTEVAKMRNYYFEGNNRNKRSMVLNLRTEKGKEVFFKMIGQSDVFLTNLRLDVPDKLGIGYEVLKEINPRLIYAHASGWGRNGPDVNLYSYDYTGIARGGLMMMAGERDTPPGMLSGGLGDEMGGLMCAFSIVIALYAREKTGKGQLVDTSLLGSIIALGRLILAAPAIMGQEFPRGKRAEANNPLYNHYKCKDDKWMALAMLQSDRYWPNFCKAMGLKKLEKDPKFNNMDTRRQNSKELVAILDKKFATKKRDAWLKIFREADVIYTPVQTPLEVVNDEQSIVNDYVITYDHPVLGKTTDIGFPWNFSETPPSVKREAPEFGQHTEEVLLELGYSWEDIIAFQDSGAI